MPNKTGDFFCSIPDPELRRAVGLAAYANRTTVVALVRDILVRGLADQGFVVSAHEKPADEPAPVSGGVAA